MLFALSFSLANSLISAGVLSAARERYKPKTKNDNKTLESVTNN